MTLILGIDPGYSRCGFGVIRDNGSGLEMVRCGVIETSPALPFPYRLRLIQTGVIQLLNDFYPDVLAVEKPVHGQNVTNSVEVGAAFGAVLLAGEEQAATIRIYWPSEVKAAVLKGNAKKAEVQRYVALILGLDKVPKPDDAADGLAVAICAANRWVADSVAVEAL